MTRQQLIQSAVKIFTEKGYHNAKISDIVQDAGFAQGTFYLYFKNKESLFRTIVEEHFNGMIALMEQSFHHECDDELTYDQFVTFLEHLFQRLLTAICKHKPIIKMVRDFGTNTSDIEQIFDYYHKRKAQLIKEQFKDMELMRHYTEEQLEIAAYASCGMVDEISTEWFINRKESAEAIPRLSKVLADLHARIMINYPKSASAIDTDP